MKDPQQLWQTLNKFDYPNNLTMLSNPKNHSQNYNSLIVSVIDIRRIRSTGDITASITEQIINAIIINKGIVGIFQIAYAKWFSIKHLKSVLFIIIPIRQPIALPVMAYVEASATIILDTCLTLIPTARIAPYCLILAETLMEILLIIFNSETSAIIAKNP